MLIASALAILSGIARADGYSGPAYSGGTFTVNGTTYNDSGGGGGAGGTSVSCSGAIKATFTYSGATLPQSVIVMQSASASAGALRQGSGADPSAACADGLGDTCNISTTNPSPPPGSEAKSGSASKTKYTVQSGSSPLTLTCSASASGSVPAPQSSADANVSYSAQVYPVTISIGGAQQDSSGNFDILVGQQCTASLGGGPAGGSFSNWKWSVSGTTFQSWGPYPTYSDPESSAYVSGPGPLSNSSASWYWNDAKNTSETVSCTATYTAPDGTTLSVKAMQKVAVYVPSFKAIGTPGYMQVNGNGPGGATCLYAGSVVYMGKPLYPGGMEWSLQVTTPQAPVAFGTGALELVQLVTPNESYMTLASPSVNHVDPESSSGLDTAYPYPGSTASESATPAMVADAPYINVVSFNAASAKIIDQFTDYLMYAPPGSGQMVPLATMIWNTNGNATIPPTTNPIVIGDWSNYATYYKSDNAGSVTAGSFSATNTFPSWTVLNQFNAF